VILKTLALRQCVRCFIACMIGGEQSESEGNGNNSATNDAEHNNDAGLNNATQWQRLFVHTEHCFIELIYCLLTIDFAEHNIECANNCHNIS
jgi:hypothetical protein